MHPGYGYLSENANFADAVRKAGLIFIGPSSEAMSTLGDKRASKEYLTKHAPEVPLIPGFSGTSLDLADLEAAAAKIGFPVMLKASAGGGGKGMRIVHEASQLRNELERAQSEAKRSFGSDDCILEKYIASAKHVEIQILGDRHGKVICLHERDCSVQRRHQKVVEETPCPWITPDFRMKMEKAATQIGNLLSYEGAGTVEFVVDINTEKFYFLEVNARLQVEHPVTEEVTGLDLVSLQLYVAAGGRLHDLPQVNAIPQIGHAIECRLCAEDPGRDFFPEHGLVRWWRPGSDATGPGRDVRYETAIRTGADVSIHFDSMIAKIVVWALSRQLAIQKMVQCLKELVCAGVRTNQLFLQSCLLHPAFRLPDYTTSFITSNLDTLIQNPYKRTESEDTRLGLIPSIYARMSRDQSKHSRPFSNVRPGFRNQRYDHVNNRADIVTVQKPTTKAAVDPEQQPMMCIWKPDVQPNGLSRKVNLLELPSPKAVMNEKEKDGARQITAYWNQISNLLSSSATSSEKAHEVAINQCDLAMQSSLTGSSWQTAILNVSIDGRSLRAYTATTSSSISATTTGKPAQLFIHFPHLGTWFEYRLYSPLSYIESLRQVTAAAGLASRIMKAPMPCKVLSVLKFNGDSVKAGDSVMVIESMKMEISIAANVDGTFEGKVVKGEAVEEGKVLCEIKE